MNHANKAQQLISVVVAIVLFVSTIPIGVFTVNAATTIMFAGGTGSVNNPYLIETKEQLNDVRNYPDSCFKLNNNLVFASEDFSKTGLFYNKGKGFEPIGTYEKPFSGTFDGNNCSITGLTININSSSRLLGIGLFGYSSGTVENLMIRDVSVMGIITGNASTVYAGGICGYLSAGTIKNCRTSGKVLAHETCVESIDKSIAFAGGIAGKAKKGSVISSCTNLAKISACAESSEPRNGGTWNTYARAGGIVGETECEVSNSYNAGEVIADVTGSYAYSYAGGIVSSSSDNILNCYNTGNVKSVGNPNNDAGGIVGVYSKGTISNCFNTGNITAEGDAGGATGYLGSGTITNFYNIGNITIIRDYHHAGGVVGYYEEEEEATIENSYYLNTTPKGMGKGSGSTISCDLSALKNANTFVGFDFENVWTFEGSNRYVYPELRNVETICPHNYTAATCSLPQTCKDCGVISGEKLSHKSDTGTVTTKATCNATGIKTYKCTLCKEIIKTETLPNLVHDYDSGKVTKVSTCIATGVITYTCNGCKGTKTETIAKSTVHIYKSYVTKATLSKNGSIIKKCTVCGSVASNTVIKYAKTFKLSATNYTYSGSAKKPTVKVYDSAGKHISSSNYTVSYKNNKNVGKATVTITFKGNYSGTKTLTFTINPKSTSVSKLTAGKKSLKVSIKKQSSQVTGYEIQYSTSKKFTSAKTKTIKSYKTTSTTIKSLKAKKTYYVRVRTYKTVNGKKYYSGWSSYKSKKTK